MSISLLSAQGSSPRRAVWVLMLGLGCVVASNCRSREEIEDEAQMGAELPEAPATAKRTAKKAAKSPSKPVRAAGSEAQSRHASFRKALPRQIRAHLDRGRCIEGQPTATVVSNHEVRLQFLHYCKTSDKRPASESAWKLIERIAQIRPKDLELKVRAESYSIETGEITKIEVDSPTLKAIADGVLEVDQWGQSKVHTTREAPPARASDALAVDTSGWSSWKLPDKRYFDEKLRRRLPLLDCVKSVDEIEYGSTLNIALTLDCPERQPGVADVSLWRAATIVASLFKRNSMRAPVEFRTRVPRYVDPNYKGPLKSNGKRSPGQRRIMAQRKQVDVPLRYEAFEHEMPVDVAYAIRTRKFGLIDWLHHGKGALTKPAPAVAAAATPKSKRADSAGKPKH